MDARSPNDASPLSGSGVALRRKKVIRDAVTLLAVGVLYAGFVQLTGCGIPCPLHFITGLQCPGCGTTRMCMALLHLDFKAAFAANPAVLCLLPLMAMNAAQMIWLFIHRAKTKSAPTEIINWFAVGVLVIFGVIRNLI